MSNVSDFLRRVASATGGRGEAHARFIGPGGDTPSEAFVVTDEDAQEILGVLADAHVGQPIWGSGPYSIGVDPDSESSSVLLRFENEAIGFYEGSCLWIAPEHRGKALSVPLILVATIERSTSVPTVLPGGVTMHGYSIAGLAAHDAAFDVLWAAQCDLSIALAHCWMPGFEHDTAVLDTMLSSDGPREMGHYLTLTQREEAVLTFIATQYDYAEFLRAQLVPVEELLNADETGVDHVYSLSADDACRFEALVRAEADGHLPMMAGNLLKKVNRFLADGPHRVLSVNAPETRPQPANGNQAANALRDASKAFLNAFGGNVPDWLSKEFADLESATLAVDQPAAGVGEIANESARPRVRP